jgi:hypothetical protein
MLQAPANRKCVDEQLSCSSHTSFVPQTDGRSLDPALTSNEKYERQFSRLVAAHVDDSKPGLNFSYLRDQYPVPTNHRDVEEQVTAFLESKPWANTPKETLWVFSFGTWDVWHLAALPRSLGEVALDGMAEVLFVQVERLYAAALLEESPAFSDFWGLSPPDLHEKVASGAPTADTRAETEVFRLLIPKILDPSLTPAWRSLRPAPPTPHSKAEHVKNAAYLTGRWNALMKAHMDTWRRSPPPKPAVPSSSTEDNGDRAEARKTKRSDDDDQYLTVPFPRKEGRVFDAPALVLDALIERQLRDTNLHDHLHRGNRSASEPIHFREVRRPCSDDDAGVPPGPASKGAKVLEVVTGVRTGNQAPQPLCEAPEDHLFYTPSRLAARAVKAIAARAAGLARRTLYLAEESQESAVKVGKAKRGSEASFVRVLEGTVTG